MFGEHPSRRILAMSDTSTARAAQRPVQWDDEMTDGGKHDFVIPAGTVTILSVDVDGVTRARTEHAPETMTALAALDDLVGEVVGRHDGTRPTERSEDHSFAAAFARASDALRAALELQTAAAELAPAHRLRAGLHTGEVLVRDSGRFVGPTVKRAAKIRDLGRGGQVLLSQTTRDLTADQMPTDAELADRGVQRLRDLGRPEHVYELRHPALEEQAGELRSLDAVPNNLPTQLSTFVGRERELAALTTLAGDHRIVTITGSGGCGKTRLALEVAAGMIDGVPDGVWFCDLAKITAPALVAQIVAEALAIKEEPNQTYTDLVAGRLQDRRAMVILDNCEHVVAAAAELADALLRRCPGVSVLTTSREPLGVEGEVTWRVPSLTAPRADELPAIESLRSFDAVQLFIDRATSARPNFVVDASTAPLIADVCARLDGIPLAIELAAARVRVMTLEQVASGLSDRFRLLGTGVRTAMPRQQTLLASVTWSHDLLTDQQRTIFRRVAVFTGPFSLSAAEHVATCADDLDRASVLELLAQLVDRSLVVLDDTEVGPRYRLLQTIRQFGRDRLAEAGEVAVAKRRHLDHYSEWIGPRYALAGAAAGREVDADYDDIRSALEWAIVDRDAARGQQLAGGLWPYWVTSGRFREGRTLTEDLLALDVEVDAAVKAAAYLSLAWTAEFMMDMPMSMYAAVQSLPLARESGVDRLVARATQKVGLAQSYMDHDAGCALLRESIELARDCEDWTTYDDSLFFLSLAKMMNAELAESARLARESLAHSTEIDYRDSIARNHWLLGWVAVYAGDVIDAKRHFEVMQSIFDEQPNVVWMHRAHHALAMTALMSGDHAEAWRHVERARDVSERTRNVYDAITAGAIAADLHLLAGDIDQAVAVVDGWNIDGLPAPTFPTALIAFAEHLRATACLARGDVGGAIAQLSPVRSGSDIGETTARAMYLVTAGRVARAAGEVVVAEQRAHEALTTVGEHRERLAMIVDLFAGLRVDVGAFVEAARLFGATSAFLDRGGMTRYYDPLGAVARDLERLRADLGDEEVEAALQDGRGMSIEDAVALIMRGRGARRRPSTGWDSLTPTERKVVHEVAEGLSNGDIAEKLFMSRRTVSTHVSHVFAKLGIKTRTELAAEATRRGV
jgi:predicted ATPase/class 3 adenylate cyclase/DNA-binding CsgD family transcriptional regulator